MKFAMRLDYARFLVMDQVTFNKLTEVLSKAEVRYQNGYGKEALYTPNSEVPTITLIEDYQLVYELPTVEDAV
jgi:hypothetical protein